MQMWKSTKLQSIIAKIYAELKNKDHMLWEIFTVPLKVL